MAVFIAGEHTGPRRRKDSVVNAAFQNLASFHRKVMHRVAEGDEGSGNALPFGGNDGPSRRFSIQQGGEDVVLCNRIGVLRDLDRLIAGGIVHGATHVNVLVLDLRRGCGVRGCETGGAVSVCPNNCAGRS